MYPLSARADGLSEVPQPGTLVVIAAELFAAGADAF